jgi:hypothetical protein
MAPQPQHARTVVLVEGPSDQRAVEALALRAGHLLGSGGVDVVAMGGVTNVAAHLARLLELGVRPVGLYDAAEERFVRGGLVRAGYAVDGGGRADLEAAGFFACVEDLEDELIRALGTERVLAAVEQHGDLPSFRTLSRQPAHRDRTTEQRLRRFLGTTSGRKIEYAGVLAGLLDPADLPRPLERLLALM